MFVAVVGLEVGLEAGLEARKRVKSCCNFFILLSWAMRFHSHSVTMRIAATKDVIYAMTKAAWENHAPTQMGLPIVKRDDINPRAPGAAQLLL